MRSHNTKYIILNGKKWKKWRWCQGFLAFLIINMSQDKGNAPQGYSHLLKNVSKENNAAYKMNESLIWGEVRWVVMVWRE